ncbi:hypothetical protein AGMMS49990_09900 [Endomicrobiia bacterium]|nr:hypothetical protein AGMMS49990_09900 [Endomicrobiia bacterium]
MRKVRNANEKVEEKAGRLNGMGLVLMKVKKGTFDKTKDSRE